MSTPRETGIYIQDYIKMLCHYTKIEDILIVLTCLTPFYNYQLQQQPVRRLYHGIGQNGKT